MLDDFRLILGGPIADPDPAKVLGALTKDGSSENMRRGQQILCTSGQFGRLASSYQAFPPQMLPPQH